jgi:hypothetical protein
LDFWYLKTNFKDKQIKMAKRQGFEKQRKKENEIKSKEKYWNRPTRAFRSSPQA